MLVSLLTLLSQSSNYIAKRAQAPIDILRLTQPVFVRASAARVQALTPGQINEIQRALTALASAYVSARDAQSEHRVAARGTLVHERSGDCAPTLRESEERADLRGAAKRDDVDLGYARTSLVVLNFVFLLVEFTRSK